MPHAPSTRTQRAQLTRAAILESARREFGRHGYDHATVRAIAAGAGIDPSMVMRYYGDKRTLFEVATDGKLRLPDLTALPARRRARALVEYFVELWAGPVAEDRFRMLLLSATGDPDAAGRMRAVITEQILPTVRAVAGPQGAETRTGLIAAAMLGVALTRLVLASPEITQVPDATLIDLLTPSVERYLTVRIPA